MHDKSKYLCSLAKRDYEEISIHALTRDATANPDLTRIGNVFQSTHPQKAV